MSDERAREIAGLLNANQKRAVQNCSAAQWHTAKEIGSAGNTLASLMWFYPHGFDVDATAYRIVQRDYMDGPLRYIYRLSDFGLAVRRILEEGNNGK